MVGTEKSVDKGTKAKDAPSRARGATHQSLSGGQQSVFGFAGVQQTAGNLAIQRFFNSGLIQAKLSISQPDDPYEQEADQVADRVMRMPEPQLQRKCACGGSPGLSGECAACSKQKRLGLQTKLTINEPGDIYEQEADRIAEQVMVTPAHHAVGGAPLRIQRFSGQSNGKAGAAPASVDQALASPGRPLEPALRQDMEQRFGHDFSGVRVHSGPATEQSARDVSAHAYTVGQDMVFGASQFAPETNEGRRLIAHELTHVVQQSGGDDIPAGLNDVKRGPSFGGQQAASIADEGGKQIPRWPATASVVALQRDSDDDLAAYIAHDLNDYVAKNPLPYKHVSEVVHSYEAKELDDNIAADFTELQSLAQLEKFAATQQGREMLDVLYNAMTTGSVTAFETLQSDRILFAKWKWSPAEVIKAAQLRDPAVDPFVEGDVDLKASKIARDLNDDAAKNLYREVINKVNQLDSYIEDNVASHFIVLQSPDKLEKFAANNEGRAMLDVLYQALITGDVTDFERLQAERILLAEAKTSRAPTRAALERAINAPAIFPLASRWSSGATIRAKLLPDGKVKVFYVSRTGAKDSEFRQEMQTLYDRYGYDAPFEGIVLDPGELVFVKLYDHGGDPEPVPAIELIDFANQQEKDFWGKFKTVVILGATVGLGGVGAGGILGWADTVTFALNAGSLFVNAYRDEIAKTALGRQFLEAWDIAEGIAEYYNWGRLGVDGLRLVHAKVSPAFKTWRQEAPTGLNSVERETIAKAQQKTEAWLDAVKKAESVEAAKYLEAHPPTKVEGAPGSRHADIEGGRHHVEEVSGGLGCKLYSDGTDVLCPKELLEHTEPPKPGESAPRETTIPTAEPTVPFSPEEVRLQQLGDELKNAHKRLNEADQGLKSLEKQGKDKFSREHRTQQKKFSEAQGEYVKAKNRLQAEMQAQGITPRQLYDRLRGRTPNAEMTRVAASKPGPYGAGASPDHIVPVIDIVEMPGLERLPPDMQVEIMNLPENTMGLDPRVNLSKGDKLWSAKPGSSRYWEGLADLGPISSATRQTGAQAEMQARMALQKAIQERLQKLGL